MNRLRKLLLSMYLHKLICILFKSSDVTYGVCKKQKMNKIDMRLKLKARIEFLLYFYEKYMRGYTYLTDSQKVKITFQGT